MKSSLFLSEIAEVMEKHNIFVEEFRVDSKDKKIDIHISGEEKLNDNES